MFTTYQLVIRISLAHPPYFHLTPLGPLRVPCHRSVRLLRDDCGGVPNVAFNMSFTDEDQKDRAFLKCRMVPPSDVNVAFYKPH